jgi:hypothetical protein
MARLVLFLMAIFGMAMFSGCATITRGTSEAYNVTSVPSGAFVSFSTGETCTTPCVIEKKRNEPFVVNIVKDGYEPFDIDVTTETCREAASTTIANLVMIGSVVWCSLDAILGSTLDLYPNPGVATLVPLKYRAEAKADQNS